ncbi:fibronectin type III domain-containing protein [Campylobacter lanienae]|uniref:Fibronectin type III domain-containing protein n=1 Tax=Campylobacter lanienae TaxID=75658 RepID=A0ABY3G9G6_9BACT|nr:fibronectin type III domain-containing protein [Campylobacter lanienae]TWO29265.1 fibronectin type III domain-containing protein [Campylobacter lanienae]
MRALRLIFCVISLMIFLTGCITTKTTQIDPSLPTISELKTISDMTEIAFEWPLMSDYNISGYQLYRSNPNDNNQLNLIAKLNDKFATHYVDTNLAPATEYLYELRTYNELGNISAEGQKVSAMTQPLIESVTFIQALYGLPNKIKVLWRPHPDLRVASYILEKSSLSNDSWHEVARINGRLNVEYIDNDVEPGQNYRYRISVKTYNGIISAPSKVVDAQTKALPNMVINLSASVNLPKKIILTWEPNSNDDFDHYAIYRATNDIFPMAKIATTLDTAYEDLINDNGVNYYYKVTAVDKDGLESPRQNNAVVGSTLATPKEPIFSSAKFNGSSVELNWDQGSDLRAIKYKITKSSSEGEFIIYDINSQNYSDFDVRKGLEYTYKIQAIDEFGLESKYSQKAVVITK